MIRGAEHVGIKVSDMERSLRFYQEVFGLVLRKRDYISGGVELAFLHHPNQPDFEVELIGRPVDAVDGYINHLAIRVVDIEAEIDRLEKMGIEFEDRVPGVILGDVKIVFFRGPDGERLELVERP